MASDANGPVLLSGRSGGILTLTLNRPAQANTLSEELMDRLEEELVAADADSAVRVLVLAANGKIFCAGHDLAEMQAGNGGGEAQAGFEALFSRCSRMMMTIRNCSKPVIAKVQGAAVAAGCQMVAACDLAYAADNVKFGVNGINLGLFCSTPSVALSRAVLPKQALELLLTGELIPAARAAEIGLVNRTTSPDMLDAVVNDVAQSIANKLPAAIGIGKALFYEQLALDEAGAYELAGARMAENIVIDDTRTMIDNFLTREK
ncbi:MAG: enoyl-CoA hydratase [Hyphomicrobiales bacterium]|nr:enoyl-CoA hydratase [Hyphomicrobiales bacterium]